MKGKKSDFDIVSGSAYADENYQPNEYAFSPHLLEVEAHAQPVQQAPAGLPIDRHIDLISDTDDKILDTGLDIDRVDRRPDSKGLPTPPTVRTFPPTREVLPADVPTPLDEIRARKWLKQYLGTHSNVRKAMVWGFGSDAWDSKANLDNPAYWKDYDGWTTGFKKELEKKFVAISISPETPSLAVDPGKFHYTYDEIKEAYLAYVAYALYLESMFTVPWRLHDIPHEYLCWLLHGRYIGFSYNTEIDFENTAPPHPGYQFGYVEKMSTFRSASECYPLAMQVIPGDPYKTGGKVYTDMNVNRATTIKNAISSISRWAQDHLEHGGEFYNNYGTVFIVNDVYSLYPPMDMVLFNKISPKDIRSLKANLEPKLDPTVGRPLPQGITPDDLISSDGLVADPSYGWDAGQGPKFPPYIGFTRHNLYDGCQAGGGFLHWLLRSVNIPSKFIPFFMGDSPQNYPNAFHRGLEVYDGSKSTIVMPHTDYLYQGTTVQKTIKEKNSLGQEKDVTYEYKLCFLDPHIDLLKLYTTKDVYQWWFGGGFDNAQKDDPSYFGKCIDLHNAHMLLLGAAFTFSCFVIDWWKEYERVAGDEQNMDFGNVQWLKILKLLHLPPNYPLNVALDIVNRNIKNRIDEIKNGVNTRWGKTLADYEKGYNTWLDDRKKQKIIKKIWVNPNP